MELIDSKFPSDLRFGKVKEKFWQRKNNLKTTELVWIVLSTRFDDDFDLYNPMTSILLFLILSFFKKEKIFFKMV